MRQKPPPEGRIHIVKKDEWVGGIAVRYGFADWEKDIWKHANNSELRKIREDPRVLAVGDDLFIPPWQEKEESGATEKRHTFKLKTPNEYFRLRILDEDGDPVADAPYTLEVEYGPGGGTYKQQGKKTDSDGVLEEVIPSTAVSGRLIVSDAFIDMLLNFGHLNPLDDQDEKLSIQGAQQRLKSLGFYDGDINGVMNPELQEAIAKFQRFCHENLDAGDSRISDPGDIDGTLSEKTIEALQKYYGC